MKINNKRGLSAVVTTVIVVLLVIVAITIVWNFVRPTIEDTGATIGGETLCLQVDAVPVTCVRDSSDGGIVKVKVKNDNPELVNVKLIIEKDDDTSVVHPTEIAVNPYATSAETSIDVADYTSGSGESNQDAVSFKIAAVVTSEGNPFTCSPSSSITCTGAGLPPLA